MGDCRPGLAWWTDERIEELKSRWANHESASQIAWAMNAGSRNTILGKVWRLDLPKRTKINGTKNSTKRRKRKYRAAVPLAMLEQVDAVIEEPPAMFENPKTFEELGPRDCHWPGEPGPDQLFCAAPAMDKRPYCALHCRMSYARTDRRVPWVPRS